MPIVPGTQRRDRVNTDRVPTKSLVVVSLLFLVGSTCIIGWSNKVSEDAVSAKTAAADAQVAK